MIYGRVTVFPIKIHFDLLRAGTGHGYGTHLWDIRAILLTPRILRVSSPTEKNLYAL